MSTERTIVTSSDLKNEAAAPAEARRRADHIASSGGYEEAIILYRQVLDLRSDDAVAANNMGNTYQKMGRFDEAASCYRMALDVRPDSAEIRTNLGRALDAAGHARQGLEELHRALQLAPDSAEINYHIATLLEHQLFLEEARTFYEAALRLRADYPAARLGLGAVLADLGFEDAAWEQRRLGHADRVLSTVPALGNDHPIRVLKLMSAVGGNIPLDQVLTPLHFEVSELIVEFADRMPPSENYDTMINVIGDADLCQRGLEAAAALLRTISVRPLNPPERILPTGRASLSERLAALDGVRTARVRTLPRQLFREGRAAAALAAEGWRCPLLLRSPGYHGGHHFPRVETFDQIDAAGAGLPGNDVLAIEWLDSADADGMFRKYRAMLLGGETYPLHLAVSQRWKVHYFSSDMATSEAYRTEELRYLSDPASAIGDRAMLALRRIGETLGLDYAGVDFAIGADGTVLVFEANATMRIVPPPTGPLGDLRRPFIERAMAAARMLFSGNRMPVV
jgi:hypothetical protein